MNHDTTVAQTASGYGRAARRLHWCVAVLVLAEFLVAALMPEVDRRVTPGLLINLHLSLGLLVLVAMALRLALRSVQPRVAPPAGTTAWEQLLARATHVTFYALLLIAPWLGWASASAHRLPVTFFGWVALPELAAPRARWAHLAGDIHATSMWILLGLIALHVAAALYHHWIRGDETLRRMWR